MNWRKYADWNTKYFHTIAKVKKSRSKILCLKNNDDIWIHDQEVLKTMARLYFMNVLTTTHSSSLRYYIPISSRLVKETYDLFFLLTHPLLMKLNAFYFKWIPLKSRALMVYNLHKFWKQLRQPITRFIQDCFTSSSIPSEINNS